MYHRKSIIVYGPPGSGKSMHAEDLRKHFGLDSVFETDSHALSELRRIPKAGALIIMIDKPAPELRRVLHIDEALRRLRHEPAGYPFP